RLEALELSLRRKDGAEALREAGAGEHEIIGAVAELVTVTGGHEAAIAAALDQAGSALAVGSVAGAARAVRQLRADDAGRATRVVGPTARTGGHSAWPELPEGAVWAREVIEADAAVRPAVEQLLDRVAVVADADAALALVTQVREVTAVTAEGDVFGPGLVRGGSNAAPS